MSPVGSGNCTTSLEVDGTNTTVTKTVTAFTTVSVIFSSVNNPEFHFQRALEINCAI